MRERAPFDQGFGSVSSSEERSDQIKLLFLPSCGTVAKVVISTADVTLTRKNSSNSGISS